MTNQVYKGANRTLSDSKPSQKIDFGDVYGKVRVSYDSWAVAEAAIETSDVVKLMKIPKNSRVIGLEMKSPDQGTTGTIDIGYAASEELDSSGSPVEAADADAFGAAVDVKTAAAFYSMSDQVSLAGQFKKFDAEVDLQLSFSEALDAGTGTIEVILYYIVE